MWPKGISTRLRRRLPPWRAARCAEAHLRNAAGALYNRVRDTRLGPPYPAGPLPIEGVQGRYFERPEDIACLCRLAAKRARYRRMLDAMLSAPPHAAEPPRILFLLDTLGPTGGVLSVAQLAHDLRDRGWRVTVAVSNPHNADTSLAFPEPPLFFAGRRHLIEHLPEADIAVATFWSTMYLLMLRFLRAPRFVPAYFVQDFEPLFYPHADPALRRDIEATYRLTPHCFAKTPWIADHVREAGGHISLVPPALDLDRFRPGPHRRNARPIVLTMLRPDTPYRGADTARATLERLAALRPDIEIHAFGCADADLPPLTLPVPFTNHGRVSNEAMPALYQCADIFLECSRFHGFGRTVAEAMACGAACVITSSGGVDLFARPGENCLTAAPGDAPALCAAIVRLLEDPALRTQFAETGPASVAPFTRAHSADATSAFLRNCLRRA